MALRGRRRPYIATMVLTDDTYALKISALVVLYLTNLQCDGKETELNVESKGVVYK